jgi:putative metalloprotease
MNRRQAFAILPGLVLAGASLRALASPPADPLVALGARMAARSDRLSFIATLDNPYTQRLSAALAGLTDDEGLGLGIKVYLVGQPNALVFANGAIRFYTGLIATLDPYELRYVLCHEIGHLAAGHVRARLQAALAGRPAGEVPDSQLGDLADAITSAPYTEAEERAADDLALAAMGRRGWDPAASISALEKFARISSRRESWATKHPLPADRARRLRTVIG